MKKDKYQTLLDIGILLSAEKDHDKLFELILRTAMDVTGADAGTLYTCGPECLFFKIMITKSLGYFKGGKGDPIDLPPVMLRKENVCAAAVLLRKSINIPDVYDSDLFDFSGPRNYDKLTGYRTKSVLVVPMENDQGEIIGVLQLLNDTDENGELTEFDTEDERIIAAIASQAAICLTNVNYANQISDLLNGFVRVMVTGIDARTPYNANHTKNMVTYGDRFFDYESRTGGRWAVTDDQRSEILMSVWLHDIGKLITPLEVMDKSTRLGDSLPVIENRFGRMELLARLDAAEGREDAAELEERVSKLRDDLDFIKAVNGAGFLPDEKLERIVSIGKQTYRELDGTETPVLTEQELSRLSIRKGTLTADERSIMEGHVSMTAKMLSGLEFPKLFEHVPLWAGSHHEFLNGRGYPNHLSGDALPWQTRFLTILDIFEALTAKDRPYKPPMPVEKALSILDSMVADGQLDPELLNEFRQSRAWETA